MMLHFDPEAVKDQIRTAENLTDAADFSLLLFLLINILPRKPNPI
jgi:hypothetical protein